MTERRVIICGGGTGGHLYPALVIGSRLREMDPAVELTYVGTRRGVERKIMESHGVRFVPITIEGLKGRGLRSLKALALLPFSFLQARRIIVKTRPALVVGVGGYSSGPVVLLSSLRKIPTLILEPNAYPGFTNRLLARWVRRAVVAFDVTLPFFKGKGVRLGNPVRPEFQTIAPRTRDGRLSLLVFGGSQGSHFLNEKMTEALSLLAPSKGRLTIAHQTGESDLVRVREAYAAAGFAGADVAPFFDDMPARFAAADLLLCRAGATTVSEIAAARRAAILVPFAGASEDHQTRNARELEASGAAEVIPESGLAPELLAARILHHLDHPEDLEAMAARLAAFGAADAAGKIARLALDLMAGDAKETPS